MPTFGEIIGPVFAFSLSAVANKASTQNNTNNASYQAPAGYVILSVIEDIHIKDGITTNSYDWVEAPDDSILEYERFNDELHEKTEGLFDNLISNNKIKTVYDGFKKTTEAKRKGSRGFNAEVVAFKYKDLLSKIDVSYRVFLMYVGNKADVNQHLDEWLSGVTVEKHFRYYDVVASLRYLNAIPTLKDDLLIVSRGDKQDWGSVFFEIRSPLGSKATFNTRVSTVGSPKTCEAVIWDMIAGPGDKHATSGNVLVNDWQDLRAEYSEDTKGLVLRFEVYSHDNIETDMVINLNSTKGTIKKTF